MKIINIKENDQFLNEYIKLCNDEWGSERSSDELQEYINNKREKIITEDKVISILGLIDDKEMIGFISLFKYDGNERRDLTPWYATMYVKKEHRNKGFSKLLNNAILEEARKLGYNKIYLKTDLVNYYEKFGAKYLEKLKNGENLYIVNLDKNK